VVVSTVHIPTQGTLRRIRQLQTITMAWMAVEAAISLNPYLTLAKDTQTRSGRSISNKSFALVRFQTIPLWSIIF
jgi:hypothetical protein